MTNAKEIPLAETGSLGLLLILLGIPLAAKTEILPVQLLHQKNGSMQGAILGYSVAGVGDLNGDGRADFIVGAFGVDTGGVDDVGAAYVYSGGDGALLFQKFGADTGAQFGLTVAGTGDVNGDGTPDFIVGAYLADPFNRADAGSAFVYSGIDGSLIDSVNGGFNGDRLGGSVAGTGDVNGDGRPDYIVGAEGANPASGVGAGSAFVYSGATGDLLYRKDGAGTGDQLGFSVAGAGDVNADGFADFIVGAPFALQGGLFNAGSAYVYSGTDGTLLYQKNGADSSYFLGLSVAGAGDINGDGKADFMVGAPGANPGGANDAGSVFVYSGADGVLLYQKDGAAVGDLLGDYGCAVGAGDLNSDGRDDFLLGARYANPDGRVNAGSVFAYSGADGSLLFQIDGTLSFDYMGSAAGAGDVNGDGKLDVLAGAQGTTSNGLISAGSAYVYGLVPTGSSGEKQNRPSQFELSQNYPNPFNPTTTIRYYLPKREKVRLEIFNLAGQRVKVLADGDQAAGEHTIIWDGTDDRVKILPSGVYFYKLLAKDFTESRKMIFLK